MTNDRGKIDLSTVPGLLTVQFKGFKSPNGQNYFGATVPEDVKSKSTSF